MLLDMEVPTLSRRDRERLARRRAMLDAALVVFADKGYDGATLDEIAERAEFGKGTLYNYFPDGKESILFALLDEMFDGMAALVRTHFEQVAGDGRSTREHFRDFIARLLHHFTDNRETFFLLIKEAQRLMLTEHAHVPSLHRRRDRAMDELVKPIERAITASELRPLPPILVAHMLMGNIKGYLMYASPLSECDVEPGDEFASLDEAADFITTILFDGLLPRD
ncbi:MAG: TetR/AcrR family transcriptional regulator [Rhodothermales bacterium]